MNTIEKFKGVWKTQLLKLDTEGDFSAWIADLRCRLSAATDENDKQSHRECFTALASMIRTVHVFKAEYGELVEYMCAVLRDPRLAKLETIEKEQQPVRDNG